MTHFHARAHEVRAMLAGDEFVIVRPLAFKMDPSINRNFTGIHVETRGNNAVQLMTPNSYVSDVLTLPYAIGDLVVVKEAFYETDKISRLGLIDGICVPVVYRADWPEAEWRFARWRSPQNMRPEWSRLTLSVDGVSVKRLQEITEDEDAETFGLNDLPAFLEWWEGERSFPDLHTNPWVVTARCQVHQRNIAKVTSEEAA